MGRKPDWTVKTTNVAKTTLRDLNRFASKYLTDTFNAHALVADKNTPYAIEIELMHEFYSDMLVLVQQYEARITALEVMEPN